MAELSREPTAGRVAAEPVDGPDVPDVGEVVEEPRVRRLDIVGHRNLYFAISLVIIVPGMLSMIFRGFLLGIDFQGGTEFFFKFQNQVSLQQVEAAEIALLFALGASARLSVGLGTTRLCSRNETNAPQREETMPDGDFLRRLDGR